MGTCKKREHMDALEARVGVATVRPLSRSAKFWGARVLLATDSEVARGAFGKGRSPSWPLLLCCGPLASLCLGLKIRPRWRRISTDRNPSDNPSRGVRNSGVFKKGTGRLDLRQVLFAPTDTPPEPPPGTSELHPALTPAKKTPAAHPLKNRGAGAWDNTDTLGPGRIPRAWRPKVPHLLVHAVTNQTLSQFIRAVPRSHRFAFLEQEPVETVQQLDDSIF